VLKIAEKNSGKSEYYIIVININIKTKRLFIRGLIVFESVFRGILGSPFTLKTLPAHFLKPTKPHLRPLEKPCRHSFFLLIILISQFPFPSSQFPSSKA